jgi:hypothetical protein
LKKQAHDFAKTATCTCGRFSRALPLMVDSGNFKHGLLKNSPDQMKSDKEQLKEFQGIKRLEIKIGFFIFLIDDQAEIYD